ncbi:hypothetical protein [Streptomyces sp. SP18BB07]|uniref:hypothetical protein n=1 Tax=Streptomyces sp. SP18BB07 TaxID=3002522 RepID=UPI002E7A39F6|nr:hypothetical protein [Streptomyces sp. SP18BB07]MEE1765016.1 hypothetical protein [Streptomyces sp. SP18BB07]
MEIFVTVVVILAMIALGVLLIHLLNAQHGDRSAAFHYGRSGMPAPGPARSVPRRTSRPDEDERHRRRVRLRTQRRTRQRAG